MLKPGQNYLVRTVTDYWLGELVSVDGPYTVTLSKISWVAETGRLADFMRDGHAEGMEVEPYPEDIRGMRQWLGIDEWPHPLLREQV